MISKMERQNENDKMNFIVFNSLNDKRSMLSRNLLKIEENWKICSNMTIEELCNISKKCTVYSKNQDTDYAICAIKELNSVLDEQSDLSNFSRSDIGTFIELLSFN